MFFTGYGLLHLVQRGRNVMFDLNMLPPYDVGYVPV